MRLKKSGVLIAAVCLIAVLGTVLAVSGAMRNRKNNVETNEHDTVQNTESQSTAKEEVKDIHAGQAQSIVSGKWIDENETENVPVSVMYSNIKQAMPQSNISKADIVFESLVEGGITRLCCVFENQSDLEKIGPVRSCRTYYLLFAKEFEANYVHFGYSEYAADYLAQPKMHALDGMVWCSFYRTDDRVAPHNAYTSWSGIMDSVNIKGYGTTYPDGFQKPFTFNADETKEVEAVNGTPCMVFYPGYRYNNPYFEYDEKTKEYLRFQFDGPQTDAETGEQLSFKNILVKYVEPAYYENGTPNYKIHGSGKGLFITDGKVSEVTWVKEAEDNGPTKYYYQDGNEIVLNQGKTYICQIETTQEITIQETFEIAE